MTLRAKLVALFTVFGVTPIVALGILTYVQSTEAVEALIAERTGAIAQRAAAEIGDRYGQRQSDLLLLAENAETQRLYRARAAQDPGQFEAAFAAADRYLRRVWQVVGSSYRWVEFRDTSGVVLYSLGARRTEGDEEALGLADLYEVVTVTQPIRDIDNSSELGTIRAAVHLRAMLPREALATTFGSAGYSVIMDRSVGRVLYHPRRTHLRRTLQTLLGRDSWNVDPAVLASTSGSFVYEEENATRLASFASLGTPPWTVVASASVDEFSAPFARTRLINLVLVLLAALIISVVFVVATRRMTRSLAALTAAADEVASGNFEPQLPPTGQDEVGKLSAAFATMVQQVREMLRRIEESRHMAVIGQFASQLSHEIRNPLTSIKLNLQRLDRGVASQRIPEEYAGPVGISLREVSRLDHVVRGVLNVSRMRAPKRELCSLHEAIEESLEVIGLQLDEQGIVLQQDLVASEDVVRGDAEQLKGVFLNLLLNAAEAMPDGGAVTLHSEVVDGERGRGQRVIRVRIADEGHGVSPEMQEKIFEPFFTTKEEGTGFGLALAQHVVEEHEGILRLESVGTPTGGAVFVVELPLAGDGHE